MHPSATLGIAALALIVSGCVAGSTPDSDGKIGEAKEALTVCPTASTVPGIDVSEWQGNINWGAVAGAGTAFAIARIGDGTYKDPYFDGNWSAIKANGMIRGAYLFYEPTDDATAQANMVVAAVGMLGNGDLPVTLDVETTQGSPNATDIGTWVNVVTQGTGKRPMIYTAPGYWDQYFNGQFSNLDVWIANWGVSCPSVPNSWTGWLFWQTGTGGTAGISGAVDQDVFNGALADLQSVASADTSQNCSAGHVWACGHFGCGCADDQCSGDFCDGSGCSAQHTSDCGNFGCACADAQCSGGFCPGSGCTVKETSDCSKFGCGCVDHACSGGACPGTDCTAKEALDCKNQNMACSNTQCVPAGSSSASTSSASTSGASTSSTSTGSGGTGGATSSTSTGEGGAGAGSPQSDGGVAGNGNGSGNGNSATSGEFAGAGGSGGGNGGAGGSAILPGPDAGLGGTCSAVPGRTNGTMGALLSMIALALCARRRERRLIAQ